VCPGQDNWTAFAEPALPDVQGYIWTGFPWGNGTHVTRFHDMHGFGEPINIPDNAPAGIYQICAVGYTGCDTTDIPVCFDLEIIELGGVSEPETYCPEEFDDGIEWEGLFVNGPGIYTVSYISTEGCPYDSTKEFLEYPESFVGYFDTLFCGEALIYDGEEYFNPGSYPLYYENANSYGCDSFGILDIDLTYIEVETDFHCLNGQFVFTSEIIVAVPNMNGIQYRWIPPLKLGLVGTATPRRPQNWRVRIMRWGREVLRDRPTRDGDGATSGRSRTRTIRSLIMIRE
jgi:hypothetical protein